ncbi:hypothetical protein GCM10009665_67450 [Kitasatospora nipponensis]|uniref:Uncharacterized protein n=1 Tax=Kitasatospora nipponensis TaxID=258049 RepID=A0ABN1WZP3_9ACTN
MWFSERPAGRRTTDRPCHRAARLPKSRALSSRRSTINIAIRRAARASFVAATGCCVLAAGLTACGTVKELTAAQQVSTAFGKLADSKDLSVKLTLDATPEQLVAYGKATGEPMEQKDAEGLAGLSVSVALHADKPLKDLESLKNTDPAKDAQAAARIEAETEAMGLAVAVTNRSGVALAEYRQVAGSVYLRVDAEGLSKLGGEDPAGVRAELDALPPQAAPLKQGLTGKWISIDAKTLKELGAEKGGPAGAGSGPATPSAAPSLDPKVGVDLVNALKDVFAHDLTFEDKGQADGARHVLIKAPTRRIAEDVMKAVKPLEGKLPGGAKVPTALPTDLLDREAVIDVAVKGGALASARFDLAQLEKKAGADVHLPLQVGFDPAAPAIQAPTGATALTRGDLENAFGMLVTAAIGKPDLGAGGSDPAGGAATGGGGLPGTPAAPLTAAELKDLVAKTGQSEETLIGLNKLGLSHDQILALGEGGDN